MDSTQPCPSSISDIVPMIPDILKVPVILSTQDQTPPQLEEGSVQVVDEATSPSVVSTEGQDLTCPHCRITLASVEEYDEHILMEEDQRPFQCETCARRFKQKKHLKRHVAIHSDVKDYHCKLCNKRFRRNDNLTSHLRVHITEAPFSCPSCPERFRDAKSLEEHVLSHSQVTAQTNRTPRKDPVVVMIEYDEAPVQVSSGQTQVVMGEAMATEEEECTIQIEDDGMGIEDGIAFGLEMEQ